jgi:hypothetical protein
MTNSKPSGKLEIVSKHLPTADTVYANPKRFLLACGFLTSVVSCIACGGTRMPEVTATPAPVQSNAKLWSIGIAQGSNPITLSERSTPRNPVLTWRDIRHPDVAFVADPFLIRRDSVWHLFFELFNTKSGRGELGVASSTDLSSWRFEKVVLAEPFHLSYPFVFEHEGAYFMIPESREAHGIRLYRATNFPLSWTFERELIVGDYSDPSPVFFQGRWWIFACKAPYSLAIFYADALWGPWHEHAKSPVYVQDKGLARPGGRPVVVNGELIRFVQDNREGYGKKVRAMSVDTLSPTEFAEHPVAREPFFAPYGAHWARNGMHHVAPVQREDETWIAAIDGNGDGRPELADPKE